MIAILGIITVFIFVSTTILLGKYYIFFTKKKYQSIRTEKICNFKTVALYSVHAIMMLSFFTLGMAIIVELCGPVFKFSADTMLYITGFRKMIMFFVQHLKAFCLLLVFYYVGLNSQKKLSKKLKKIKDIG